MAVTTRPLNKLQQSPGATRWMAGFLVFGLWKVQSLRYDINSEIHFYGFNGFLGVARQFLAPRLSSILLTACHHRESSAFTSISTIPANRHLRAWSAPSFFTSTASRKIFRNQLDSLFASCDDGLKKADLQSTLWECLVDMIRLCVARSGLFWTTLLMNGYFYEKAWKDSADAFWRQEQNVNSQGGFYNNALQAACAKVLTHGPR